VQQFCTEKVSNWRNKIIEYALVYALEGTFEKLLSEDVSNCTVILNVCTATKFP